MANTKKYIVELRNATIIWVVVAIAMGTGLWFSFNLFSQLGQKLEEHNQKKIYTIDNIRAQGIISDKVLEEGNLDSLRLSTIKQLVPNITTTLGIGTSEEQRNLATLRRITQKDTSEKDYITWLQSSWDAESKDNLEKLEDDIAEIIPIFSGVTGVAGFENTKHITGKITLKSLIDFIQKDISEEYNLGYAVGSIGIDGVRFSSDNSEIGAYDIPLKFDKISNKDAIRWLEFLARTGGIRIEKMENNQFSLSHIYPREEKKLAQTDETLSQLKNPLIIISNLSIAASEKDVSLTTEQEQEWNIGITLTFYIRGVSSDHLMKMDQSLDAKIGNNQPGELVNRANRVLNTCQKNPKCGEENKISDIITLLNTARDTYKSILSADKTSTPLVRVKRRSDLMTTIGSIENKLTQIESYQTTPPELSSLN